MAELGPIIEAIVGAIAAAGSEAVTTAVAGGGEAAVGGLEGGAAGLTAGLEGGLGAGEAAGGLTEGAGALGEEGGEGGLGDYENFIKNSKPGDVLDDFDNQEVLNTRNADTGVNRPYDGPSSVRPGILNTKLPPLSDSYLNDLGLGPGEESGFKGNIGEGNGTFKYDTLGNRAVPVLPNDLGESIYTEPDSLGGDLMDDQGEDEPSTRNVRGRLRFNESTPRIGRFGNPSDTGPQFDNEDLSERPSRSLDQERPRNTPQRASDRILNRVSNRTGIRQSTLRRVLPKFGIDPDNIIGSSVKTITGGLTKLGIAGFTIDSIIQQVKNEAAVEDIDSLLSTAPKVYDLPNIDVTGEDTQYFQTGTASSTGPSLIPGGIAGLYSGY